MCSYEQEEEIEEHHDVGETNSICVLDADVILLGSALPSRDHWLSLNIKKEERKQLSRIIALSLFSFHFRWGLYGHTHFVYYQTRSKAEEKFSAFLAYAIKSRTEKKTIGQQLPKIQSCRDWEDSLLSLTLHSVWKRQKISELFLIWRDPVPVVCRYPIWFLKSSEYFFPKKWDLFYILRVASTRNSPSFVVLLRGSSELGGDSMEPKKWKLATHFSKDSIWVRIKRGFFLSREISGETFSKNEEKEDISMT